MTATRYRIEHDGHMWAVIDHQEPDGAGNNAGGPIARFREIKDAGLFVSAKIGIVRDPASAVERELIVKLSCAVTRLGISADESTRKRDAEIAHSYIVQLETQLFN